MATDDHMKVEHIGLPDGATSASLGDYLLENGRVVRDVVLGYTAYGELNASGDNAIVVGHSLTSNSNVTEWWGAMCGPGEQFALNTLEDFVICVNYLGSPYGSSAPTTADPDKADGGCYGADFPTPVSIRDNVRLQKMLLDSLGVKHLKMAIGGSMGSMLALEWAATFPDFVEELCLIAGCGRHTDWAIGIGEAQRFSIMADGKFKGGSYDVNDPPKAGLATSRMMAMLSYRAPASVDQKFERTVTMNSKTGAVAPMAKPSSHVDLNNVVAHANEKAQSLPYFAVESYMQYQGKKLIRRFDANCYIQLTYTLDSHDVARGRGEYRDVLRSLRHRVLVVGIKSDVLYPFALQRELAREMPHSELYAIDSPHGHDAFLIEIASLNVAVTRWRNGEPATLGKLRWKAPEEETRASSEDVGELQAAVRELEEDLARAREMEGKERDRADALLAQMKAMKDAEARRVAEAGRDGGGGGGATAAAASGLFDGGGTLTGTLHGMNVLPANPPPSTRRWEPVYGDTKAAWGLGAF